MLHAVGNLKVTLSPKIKQLAFDVDLYPAF